VGSPPSISRAGVEFDSVAAATAAYESPGYKAALDALGNGTDRDIRIMEGI